MDLEISNLKESVDFLKTLIDNITSAIFIVNEDAVVKHFNDSFKALFDSVAHDSFDKKCGNLIGCYYAVSEEKECGNTSFCGRCALRQSFINAFTQKIPAYREKLVREFYIGGKVELKYLRYTTKYIEYAGTRMALVIVDDVTELESQKIRLAELNEQKNKFLGMAAHDLRNPISVIASRKNIAVRLNYKASSTVLRFDKNRLEQVVNNLIGNAVKYSHSGTEIVVSAEDGPNGTILTKVADRGQGIPPGELESIFGAFNKSTTRSTAGEKSTGLGLAISKKMIEAHGGKIGVTSELKKGATFYFELPL